MAESFLNDTEKFLSNDAISLLGPTTRAIMIIDKNFRIIRITKACIKLFSDYYNLTIKNFFDIFSYAFQPEQMKECLKHLHSRKKGFTWAGVIGHNSQIARTIYTKLIFIPLFQHNVLQGYYALFDNITKDFAENRMNILNGLLKASKMKDKDTGYHTMRVNYYSKLLATYMYQQHLYTDIVNFDFVENIGLYAAMHDIGKIGTPDYILQKPGGLTDAEWNIMKEHTINGAMILSGFELPMAQDIAISHHEYWDGSGYPFRISNNLIPLSARIVAVADVYDALRMRRSYKEDISHDTAIEMIVGESGTHFDPDIVELTKKIHPYFDRVWEKLIDKEEIISDEYI